MEEKLKSEISVLIVGAGPTGLTAAALLSQMGIMCRVIDKNDGPSEHSKALGVQAGTLECLASAFGKKLVDEMIDRGLGVKSVFLHFDDRAEKKIDFSEIPSEFNFLLCLPQSETENILAQYLGTFSRSVERGVELVALEQNSEFVTARVCRGGGKMATEEIRCQFVIGADGAHSMVRKLVGIPFDGAAYEGNFILGDVELRCPWNHQSAHIVLSNRGMLAAFPIDGEERFRLILLPRQIDAEKPESNIEFEEFALKASYLSREKIKVLKAHWLSRFKVYHRMVTHFRRDRVFLAGDAAHIHSPVGGQGMNTGIQDAMNLAFKLKRYFDGNRSWELLDEYEAQRLPVARSIVRGTDIASRIILLPKKQIVFRLRSLMMPKILGIHWLRRKIVTVMSQIGIAKSEISRYEKFKN